ncbi:hypothetical protein F5884DRAFT_377076 [Xylogone sp. PMI_703]|nr:hypothetical protein F5884DRAFT_377076 [Xylogone sp. PMI_703]
MAVASTTCCGKNGEGCVCAAQAKCSCGQKNALHCTCEKAETENKISGPRCSCRTSLPSLISRIVAIIRLGY